jgi:hypothetical protein
MEKVAGKFFLRRNCRLRKQANLPDHLSGRSV